MASVQYLYLGSYCQITICTFDSVVLEMEKLIYLVTSKICLGAIFILHKDIGVGGWSRKWQFSLTLCSKNVLT